MTGPIARALQTGTSTRVCGHMERSGSVLLREPLKTEQYVPCNPPWMRFQKRQTRTDGTARTVVRGSEIPEVRPLPHSRPPPQHDPCRQAFLSHEPHGAQELTPSVFGRGGGPNVRIASGQSSRLCRPRSFLAHRDRSTRSTRTAPRPGAPCAQLACSPHTGRAGPQATCAHVPPLTPREWDRAGNPARWGRVSHDQQGHTRWKAGLLGRCRGQRSRPCPSCPGPGGADPGSGWAV